MIPFQVVDQAPTAEPSAIQYALENFGIPILVAILTTIVLEFFAKPRLEARKQRLIRDRQQLDEVIFAFQALSLSAGSLLPEDFSRDADADAYQKTRIQSVIDASDALLTATSRLAPNYSARHGEHITFTTRFIAMIRGRAGRVMGDERFRGSDDLITMANDLDKFDVYFRANTSMRDSQEPLVKRLVWPLIFRGETRQLAIDTMARHGMPAGSPVNS